MRSMVKATEPAKNLPKAEEWEGLDTLLKRSVGVTRMVQVAETDETETLGVGVG